MTAMRLSRALIVVALASITILGCGEKARVVEPPPPEVIVSPPLKKEVTQYLEFTGNTAALEFVEIRARVEGWLESINFKPGSQVKKGDLLFVIDPRPFQAQVDQSEAALKGKEADLQLKQANYKRAQQLLSTSSISQLQYDIENANQSVAIAQVGIARADLEKAKLDLAYSRLTAPTGGRVSRNYVDIGNLVGAKDKTLLTEIVDDSSVYVYFDVSERNLLMLIRKWPKLEGDEPEDKEKPPAYLQLADETGYPHEGKIDFVESRVDPSTGTLRVRAIFLNDKGLLVSGLFGRVRVPIEQKEALLVPELAVGMSQAGRYVLVVNKDNIVEQRLVKTGQLEGTLRVIEEGLAKDERIVVNGIQRARPGAKVSPKESIISSTPQASEKAASSSGK
jgi:membrane fusion protein, multidrug efflux system